MGSDRENGLVRKERTVDKRGHKGGTRRASGWWRLKQLRENLGEGIMW